MTALNNRLQLAMLNRKKARNALEKGFTLVELMIVVIVVGILSSVALPQFLGAKDKADLNASLGEQFALAKECSTAILGELPLPNNCTNTGAINNTFTTIAANANSATGAKCGPTTAMAANKTCIISVTPDGVMSYALSN